MDLDPILAEHGLWFALAGTAIWGDPVALSAGVLQQRGTFGFWPTVLVVAFGGWLSDLFLFCGGYYTRATPALARMLDHPAATRLTTRFLGRPVLLSFVFRLVPGTRTVVPLALGAGGTIGMPVYAVAAGAAGLVWAWLVIAAGHAIGELIFAVWGGVPEIETILLGLAVAALALGAGLVWHRPRRRSRRK